MRSFKLINKDGETYDLTVKDRAFFHTVSGLGYEKSIDYIRVQNTYTATSNFFEMGEVEGNVYFGGSGNVNDYFAFARFCQNEPLKLVYNPGNNTAFSRDGFIARIEKSDGDNPKSCKVRFQCITPWYKSVAVYNDGHITDGKVYDYSYNYTYSDTIAGSVRINSDSYMSSPAKLIIYGAVTNPTWSQYVNGKKVLEGKVYATIVANHKLVIDTTTNPYSIKEYDMANNLIADRYQQSDWNTTRFITIEHGENIINASAGGAYINLGVEAQIQYATV